MRRPPPLPPLFPYTPLFRSLKPTRIRLARDYGFDESAILAAQREEEFLRDDLGRAMAEQLVRNLEALSADASRSEEHTSELQSRGHLVCRLLLEKKNTTVVS